MQLFLRLEYRKVAKTLQTYGDKLFLKKKNSKFIDQR